MNVISLAKIRAAAERRKQQRLSRQEFIRELAALCGEYLAENADKPDAAEDVKDGLDIAAALYVKGK
jgi:hypothetical protein